MSIKQALAEWDKKSVDQINGIYGLYHGKKDFVDDLINLIKELPFQKGVTWLLKMWLESGNQLEQETANKLLLYFDNIINTITQYSFIFDYIQFETDDDKAKYDNRYKPTIELKRMDYENI